MHSSESDGTDEPEALLDLIALNNIKIFSLTDHDNINGVKRIEAKLNNYQDLNLFAALSCLAGLKILNVIFSRLIMIMIIKTLKLFCSLRKI